MLPRPIMIDLAWLNGLRAYSKGGENPFHYVASGSIDSFYHDLLNDGQLQAEMADAWDKGFQDARLYTDATGNWLG